MSILNNSTGQIPNNKTGVPLEHYRKALSELSPEDVALRCRLSFEDNEFSITLLTDCAKLRWPEGTAYAKGSGDELSDVETILLLRYLIEGSSTDATGTFLAYAEIPWGDTYLQQFTGRCIKRLAFTFGGNLEGFARACKALGGSEVKGGDCAYDVPFMQNLVVRLIIWEGDEEFPPSAQILFSDNFLTAFTAEDLAYVGDLLIGTLKARAS